MTNTLSLWTIHPTICLFRPSFQFHPLLSSTIHPLLTTLRLLKDPQHNTLLNPLALSHLLQTHQLPHLSPNTLSTAPHPPILELTSAAPKAGKSQLLYYIIASTLLPNPSFPGNEAETGIVEKGKAVALLDTDDTFSIDRMAQIALSHHRKIFPLAAMQQAKREVHEALGHLHIFSPRSLESFIATLERLPEYFLNPGNASFEKSVGAVGLDSCSAFLWTGSGASAAGAGNETASYDRLAQNLRTCSKKLNAPVLFTTEHFPVVKKGQEGMLRPQLPSPWGAVPSLRLVVQKIERRGEDEGRGGVEIVRGGERGGRGGGVGMERRGHAGGGGVTSCHVSVNRWGRDNDERLSSGAFTFYITDEGVSIL